MTESTTLRAFHGKQSIKDKYMKRLRAHHAADQITQGIYTNDASPCSKDFRGCAVGCTLHSSDHFAYETELGLPYNVAILHDTFFERLPAEDAPQFAVDFLDAIQVGAKGEELDKVLDRIVLYQMGEIVPLIKNEKALAYHNEMAALIERRVAGEDVPPEAWKELRDRINADRADRAYRAYRAYLAYLAYLADLADRADRAYLAYRADRADRADLADRADRADLAEFRKNAAAKLIELLAACPVLAD